MNINCFASSNKIFMFWLVIKICESFLVLPSLIRIIIIMGDTSSLLFSPLAQFTKITDHPSFLPIVKHNKTAQLLICQQLTLTSTQAQQIQLMLINKFSHKCPFVTELVYWSQNKNSQYCSGVRHFVTLFNNIGITLEKFYSTYGVDTINNESASNILQSVLKGLRHFNQINHLPEDINQRSLFYDGKRTILVDPWVTSCQFPQSNFVYKSPQKQLFEHDQIVWYDKFKSLLYQLGLLVLDLVTNYAYTQAKSEQNYSQRLAFNTRIGSILQTVSDFKLRSKLSILLNPNPQKRQIIYSIILPEKLKLRQFNTNRKLLPATNLPKIAARRFQPCDTPPSFTSPRNKNISWQKERNRRINTSQQTIKRKHLSSPTWKKLQKQTQRSGEPLQSCRNKLIQSSFTYAQMLKTPTETNSNYFESKKSSPLGLHKNTPANWHTPHRIIQENLSNQTDEKKHELKGRVEKHITQVKLISGSMKRQWRSGLALVSSADIGVKIKNYKAIGEKKMRETRVHSTGMGHVNSNGSIKWGEMRAQVTRGYRSIMYSAKESEDIKDSQIVEELNLLKITTKTYESVEKEESEQEQKISYQKLEESSLFRPSMQNPHFAKCNSPENMKESDKCAFTRSNTLHIQGFQYIEPKGLKLPRSHEGMKEQQP